VRDPRQRPNKDLMVARLLDPAHIELNRPTLNGQGGQGDKAARWSGGGRHSACDASRNTVRC